MYTTSIDKIEYEDIESFIAQRNEESIILDYKGDWPRDLDKTIAAMANTQGGLILIGIAEEKKSGKPGEIVGVDASGGEDALRQRVFSIAYQGIYPPVIPEVTTCVLRDNPNRAIVVVRVAQSDQTPHATDQRRRVYVRVDSQSRPHSLATLNELEWLWDRRRQGDAKRKVLLEAALERANWMLSDHLKQPQPLLRAWITPRFYSGEEVFSLKQVNEFLQQMKSTSDIVLSNFRQSFPYAAYHNRSIASGHCIYHYPPQGSTDKTFEYIELSTTGLLFSELRMGGNARQLETAEANVLYIGHVLSQIDGLLKFGSRLYPQGNFWGLLQIRASLCDIRGVILQGVSDGLFPSDVLKKRSLNHIISILNETVYREAIEEKRFELVKQTAQSILWAFGYGKDQEWFDNWFSAIWKPIK